MKAPTDTRQALGRWFGNVTWLQLGLTWLTGKALPDQYLPYRSAKQGFAMAVVALVAGVSCACAGAVLGSFTAIVLGWIPTLYGMRYLQLIIVHNASHQNFVRDKAIDFRVGFWVSTLLMIQNFEHYGPSHALSHHRWQTLSTSEDPTVQTLAKAGIRAGNSVPHLIVSLALTLFSPRYHAHAVWARIRSYYHDSSRMAKVVMSVMLATYAGVLTAINSAWPLVLCWVLPLTVLYQQSALLRLAVEHHWDATPADRTVRSDTFGLTHAVFLGSAPPVGANPLRWLYWVLAMVAALLLRLMVLPGDSGAAHDWHHQHPRGDWPNYIAARREQQASHPVDYQEVWGYWRALVTSLKSVSNRH